MLAAVALAGAGCSDTVTGELPTEPGPGIVSVSVVPGASGIFRTLAVTLEREGRVVVDYGEASGNGPRLELDSREAARTHELFLPRLRPGGDYTWTVRSLASGRGSVGGAAGAGAETERSGGLSTGALPPDLAALELEVSGEAAFDLVFLEVGRPSGPHLPVIVDAEGHVVWHSLHEGRAASGFTLFEDTLFAFNTAEGIQVISPASQELRAGLSRERGEARTGLDPFFIHHDVTATPWGTLLFLALDPTPSGDTVWMGEAVWEWNPWTDELDRRWRAGDVLDPATDRGLRSRPDDWLHANSLSIGPRGNVLVSLFWLHEVASIAPGWGALEWRLGGPASSFEGVARAMEAGQHTAAEPSPGRVLLFDNGLDRGDGRFSRALELRLDPETGRAEEVWEFRPSPDIYAPFVSSTYRLPDGGTLVKLAGIAGERVR